jgi:hypothetical protein
LPARLGAHWDVELQAPARQLPSLFGFYGSVLVGTLTVDAPALRKRELRSQKTSKTTPNGDPYMMTNQPDNKIKINLVFIFNQSRSLTSTPLGMMPFYFNLMIKFEFIDR